MRVLKKLFVTILFLFPLGEIIRIDLGGAVAIKPIDMAVGITLVYWIFLKFYEKQPIKKKHIYIPALLFVFFGMLPLIVNILNLSVKQTAISLMYLIRWISYFGILFVVNDFENNFKKIISNALMVIGAIILGLGYVQYFFYSNLRNLIYLGWDDHLYRLFSVFLDPNFAGAFFVLLFLFFINAYLNNKNSWTGILSILAIMAVFLSFSRSALIMLIISSTLYLILMQKKKIIVFIIFVIIIFFSVSSKYFNIENINLFRMASSEARLESAKNALQIIDKSPFIGIGFNAYRYAQLKYGIRTEETTYLSHADAGTDNSFLFIIATTGVIGLIIFVFLMLNLLKGTSELAVASFVGVIINSMFINSLFYPFIMLWLWIILALRKSNLT